ncbi:MAG: DUF3592 domain-containing protein [Caldithrix sp.]|nr:DUF3592 domain-containing protein [Caldithrix sp.]
MIWIITVVMGLLGILAGLWINKVASFKKIVLGLRLAAYAGLIAALLVIVNEHQRLNFFRTLQQWEPVQATIVSGQVIGDRAYLPQVIYEYQVQGTTYQDTTFFNRPSFGGRINRMESAENILRSNPVGSTLKIYHHPQHPGRSRLKIHPPWDFYGKLSFAELLLTLSLMVITLRIVKGKLRVRTPKYQNPSSKPTTPSV